jgi:hypothetical protein
VYHGLTSHSFDENRFTVDTNDEIVGQEAESVGKISQIIWEITLNCGYKFSDGTSARRQLPGRTQRVKLQRPVITKQHASVCIG